jgi:hypothetical protein
MATHFRSFAVLALVVPTFGASCSNPAAVIETRIEDTNQATLTAPQRDVEFLKISKEAQAKAQAAGQVETKIKLYFDAARTAWDSRAPGALEQVILSADAGQKQCDSIPADRRKPAGHCAVLAAFEPLAAGQIALDGIDANRPHPNSAAVSQAAWNAIERGFRQFDQIVAAKWPGVATVTRQSAVDPSVREWFRQSSGIQWCRVLLSLTVNFWRATGSQSAQAKKTALSARAAIREKGAPQFGLSPKMTTADGRARTKFCKQFTQVARTKPPTL